MMSIVLFKLCQDCKRKLECSAPSKITIPNFYLVGKADKVDKAGKVD